MEEDYSVTHHLNDEIFRQVCIPEIFTEILRYLTIKERLHLRMCTRAAKEAVARSDLHVVGRDGKIRINGNYEEFSIEFNDRLKIRKNFGKELTPSAKKFDEGLGELLKTRNQLFSRVHVVTVEIANVNVKTISIEYIEDLLSGFHCKEMTLTIKKKEFTTAWIDFIRKHEDKWINLILKGFSLDIDTLLSFKSLKSLQIFKRNSYTEEEFFKLLNLRFSLMVIPVIPKSEMFFIRLAESLHSYEGAQIVDFKVDRDLAERVISTTMGFRRTSQGYWARDFETGFSIDNGYIIASRSLLFGTRVHICAQYPKCASTRAHTPIAPVRFTWSHHYLHWELNNNHSLFDCMLILANKSGDD
ncbi:hypothetical protein PMAYCL1PPCAC_08208 [Pristionchus mayeri]|uniref:F-box domain-containing protein n=1 Tax=Pristionchus mayeri TaxID=1317129 RepID=A0AAN5C5D1_9BILA|nr:hypothetical protein PMAYCL1PPCAC_08208 [Pristionchus mayeri]